jgi:phosphatidate cytidylyltransferase
MNEASASSSTSRSKLVSRLIAGIGVLASFAALTWADATGFGGASPMAWLLPVVLVVAAGGGREAVRLAAAAGIPLAPWLVPVGAAAIAAAPALARLPAGPADRFAILGPAAVACMGVIAAAFASGVARYTVGGREVVRAAGSIAAAVAIGLPFAFMVSLRLLPSESTAAGPFAGLVPLISLIAVVKAGDIAAYAIGSLVGRHRMAPLLSPGKTWEGAAASIAASVAMAWLVIEQGGGDLTARPLGGWLIYGLLVGMAGMMGDLAESLVKRDLAAKDSGSILGGMGGFLDLADSLLLAGPVAWLLWALG